MHSGTVVVIFSRQNNTTQPLVALACSVFVFPSPNRNGQPQHREPKYCKGGSKKKNVSVVSVSFLSQ